MPPPPGVKDSQATFRVLLLTKCQTEFESDKTIVFEDPEEKRKKLEAELPEGVCSECYCLYLIYFCF